MHIKYKKGWRTVIIILLVIVRLLHKRFELQHKQTKHYNWIIFTIILESSAKIIAISYLLIVQLRSVQCLMLVELLFWHLKINVIQLNQSNVLNVLFVKKLSFTQCVNR